MVKRIIEMDLYCEICCDKFTNTTRHPVRCSYCEKKVCLKCFKYYLMMDGSEQECMMCKHPISTEFIFTHTPKTFKTTYTNKIIKLVIEKEKVLLKATEERMIANHTIKILKKRTDGLMIYLTKNKDDDEIRNIFRRYHNEEKMLREIVSGDDEQILNTSTSYLCPINPCKGIIMKDSCNTCNKKICSECREEKNEDHECNSDLIKTLKLLKTDTKKCPRCKSQIYKIDGCDQMFCTKCHTAFSWKTGMIQSGIIHNPHYFEFMRGADINVINIEQDPCQHKLNVAITNMQKNGSYEVVENDSSEIRWMKQNNFIHNVLGAIDEFLPLLIVDVYDEELFRVSKQQLRERYLKQCKWKGVNAEANWHNQLRLMYNKREMKIDLIKLVEFFVRAMKDFIIVGDSNNDHQSIFPNLVNLVDYFKTQLLEHEKRHGLKNHTSINAYPAGIKCGLVKYQLLH